MRSQLWTVFGLECIIEKKEDCTHIAVSRTSTVAQRALKRSLIRQQRGLEQDENQQPIFIGQTAPPPEEGAVFLLAQRAIKFTGAATIMQHGKAPKQQGLRIHINACVAFLLTWLYVDSKIQQCRSVEASDSSGNTVEITNQSRLTNQTVKYGVASLTTALLQLKVEV